MSEAAQSGDLGAGEEAAGTDQTVEPCAGFQPGSKRSVVAGFHYRRVRGPRVTFAPTRSVRVQEAQPKSLAPPMNHRQSRKDAGGRYTTRHRSPVL